MDTLKDEKIPVLHGTVVKQGEVNPNFAKESREAYLKYINNK